MNLKNKFALAFSTLFICLLGAMWFGMKLQLDRSLEQQTGILGQLMAGQTASSVTELVLSNDLLGLNVVLTQLAKEPGVASVTVTDVDNRLLASSADNNALPNGPRYEAPITLQEAVAGKVIVVLDPSLLENTMSRPMLSFLVIILLGLPLIYLFSFLAVRQYQRGLLGIGMQLDEGYSLEEELPVPDMREFADVQASVKAFLQEREALLKRVEQVGLPDPRAIERLSLRAERRMSTLLLVEVFNIHNAIELLHPSTLSKLLQEFQFYLRQAAQLYQGVVLRLDGHCALVSFDVRHCGDDHAFNATCCAQLFAQIMKEVAKRHKAAHSQTLEFHQVIHSGDCFYCALWKLHKEGRKPSRDEAVLGRPVDLSYLMLPFSEPGTILASEISFNLAGGSSHFNNCPTQKLNLGQQQLDLVAFTIEHESGSHAELITRQCKHLLPRSQYNSVRES